MRLRRTCLTVIAAALLSLGSDCDKTLPYVPPPPPPPVKYGWCEAAMFRSDTTPRQWCVWQATWWWCTFDKPWWCTSNKPYWAWCKDETVWTCVNAGRAAPPAVPAPVVETP